MSLSLMVVCSVSTVVFNGNPLMRYDGYYVLADWLEIPNLQDRARRCFRSAFLRYALGIRARPEEPTTTRRRWFLFFYALASFAYRWIVTVGILWFLYRLLAPYGLGTVVALVATAAGASMILDPLYRGIRALIGMSNGVSVDRRYAVVAAAMMKVMMALICFVPLPLGGVCRTGLVEMQPDAVEQMFVPAPAILERLHVRNGQAVHSGDVLAEFRSVDLENKLAEARTGRDIKEMELEALDEASSRPEGAAERARIDLLRTAAAAERDALERESEVYDAMIKRLVLRAPKDGIILGAPPHEQIGKAWYPENPAPFCMIGEPGRLRAIVALSPADNSLLRDEARTTGGPDIVIRVAGAGMRRWQGRLASLPESESKDLPLGLTTRGGGPIPVHQTAMNRYEPYSQQYLATVNFVAADRTIMPGCLAQVRIDARSRPLAWWVWRGICATLGS
jgi:putative peptide zinc metalloprotease protein